MDDESSGKTEKILASMTHRRRKSEGQLDKDPEQRNKVFKNL